MTRTAVVVLGHVWKRTDYFLLKHGLEFESSRFFTSYLGRTSSFSSNNLHRQAKEIAMEQKGNSLEFVERSLTNWLRPQILGEGWDNIGLLQPLQTSLPFKAQLEAADPQLFAQGDASISESTQKIEQNKRESTDKEKELPQVDSSGSIFDEWYHTSDSLTDVNEQLLTNTLECGSFDAANHSNDGTCAFKAVSEKSTEYKSDMQQPNQEGSYEWADGDNRQAMTDVLEDFVLNEILVPATEKVWQFDTCSVNSVMPSSTHGDIQTYIDLSTEPSSLASHEPLSRSKLSLNSTSADLGTPSILDFGTLCTDILKPNDIGPYNRGLEDCAALSLQNPTLELLSTESELDANSVSPISLELSLGPLEHVLLGTETSFQINSDANSENFPLNSVIIDPACESHLEVESEHSKGGQQPETAVGDTIYSLNMISDPVHVPLELLDGPTGLELGVAQSSNEYVVTGSHKMPRSEETLGEEEGDLEKLDKEEMKEVLSEFILTEILIPATERTWCYDPEARDVCFMSGAQQSTQLAGQRNEAEISIHHDQSSICNEELQPDEILNASQITPHCPIASWCESEDILDTLHDKNQNEIVTEDSNSNTLYDYNPLERAFDNLSGNEMHTSELRRETGIFHLDTFQSSKEVEETPTPVSVISDIHGDPSGHCSSHYNSISTRDINSQESDVLRTHRKISYPDLITFEFDADVTNNMDFNHEEVKAGARIECENSLASAYNETHLGNIYEADLKISDLEDDCKNEVTCQKNDETDKELSSDTPWVAPSNVCDLDLTEEHMDVKNVSPVEGATLNDALPCLEREDLVTNEIDNSSNSTSELNADSNEAKCANENFQPTIDCNEEVLKNLEEINCAAGILPGFVRNEIFVPVLGRSYIEDVTDCVDGEMVTSEQESADRSTEPPQFNPANNPIINPMSSFLKIINDSDTFNVGCNYHPILITEEETGYTENHINEPQHADATDCVDTAFHENSEAFKIAGTIINENSFAELESSLQGTDKPTEGGVKSFSIIDTRGDPGIPLSFSKIKTPMKISKSIFNMRETKVEEHNDLKIVDEACLPLENNADSTPDCCLMKPNDMHLHEYDDGVKQDTVSPRPDVCGNIQHSGNVQKSESITEFVKASQLSPRKTGKQSRVSWRDPSSDIFEIHVEKNSVNDPDLEKKYEQLFRDSKDNKVYENAVNDNEEEPAKVTLSALRSVDSPIRVYRYEPKPKVESKHRPTNALKNEMPLQPPQLFTETHPPNNTKPGVISRIRSWLYTLSSFFRRK